MPIRLLDKLPKKLKDPDFVKAWEETGAEFALAREIIRSRMAAGLSQSELAEKIGTTQSVISRLESGSHTPSLSTLRRIAEVTHSRLRVEIIPLSGAHSIPEN